MTLDESRMRKILLIRLRNIYLVVALLFILISGGNEAISTQVLASTSNITPTQETRHKQSLSTIGDISDPENLEIDDYVDILSAHVEQDGGLLTFFINTRGDIPTTLSQSEDSITYLWFINADNNPNTGQPHGGLGSEFNVRVVISEVYGGGFVDVTGSMPGGGPGSVLIQDNIVKISLGLAQIASPDDFHWRCSTFQIVNNSFIPGNPETDIAQSTIIPYTSPAKVTITTPILMLCPLGPESGMLDIEIYDEEGTLLDNDNYHLAFSSTNENVATVDSSGNVTVHSVPVDLNDSPYISVWADGIRGDNMALIRSTNSSLNIIHQTYAGNNVTFYLPANVEV
jgi:hypothetical protein